ncbi:hypothetical protein B5S25_16905 [Paenibacillus larvae subsp. pulvifaciens]|nr:hypothetical protein B5S25_16905 [Paenibacillus larvae subsp. pulvifaciens]
MLLDKMKDMFNFAVAKKLLAILFLILLFYMLSDMLNILLFTFIFSFLFYTICSLLLKLTHKWVRIPEKLMVLLVYGAFGVFVGVASYMYVPVLAKQIVSIVNIIVNFNPSDYKDAFHPKVFEMIQRVDIGSYLSSAGNYAVNTTKNIGGFLLSIFLSLILSFFFSWERRGIVKFLQRFETSKVGFIYEYYKQFGRNFVNSFGKVMQVQIVISFINSILSVIMLYFMGFPQILGLGVMIFALGLVPVAGVIVSLIPLSIIAFQIGGWIHIVYVLVMITILHAFESYVLNPKLMSVKMKLPVFFTFAVLILFERLIGVWGLLIGIPLFMFFLDLVGANEPAPNKKKS